LSFSKRKIPTIENWMPVEDAVLGGNRVRHDEKPLPFVCHSGQGYHQHPVTVDEFSVWENEQAWGDEYRTSLNAADRHMVKGYAGID
jgi:hypothetical protein